MSFGACFRGLCRGKIVSQEPCGRRVQRSRTASGRYRADVGKDTGANGMEISSCGRRREHGMRSFGSKSVHDSTASAVFTADLVDSTTSAVLAGERQRRREGQFVEEALCVGKAPAIRISFWEDASCTGESALVTRFCFSCSLNVNTRRPRLETQQNHQQLPLIRHVPQGNTSNRKRRRRSLPGSDLIASGTKRHGQISVCVTVQDCSIKMSGPFAIESPGVSQRWNSKKRLA